MKTRRSVAATLLSIVLGLAPLGAALAQSQPGDPPGRVGRLAEMSGTVSFHGANETQWEPASLNYPVIGGNSFWTEPRSHAAIDVGASRIYLDSSTELDVSNVDDQSFVASLAQGAVYLRVSPGAGGDQYEIDTPRGAVHITQPGSYEVVAGDTDHPTIVMAFEGAAQIEGPGINAVVDPQQALYVSGQNPPQVNQGQAQPDDFIRFVQDEERPYENAGPAPQQGAPQYVSPEMTGYQDLNRYGQWGQDPGYGPVWYPQVAVGWAPYREGHWAYVAPWGWTWIDDAPWGFTPFHYGRWIEVGDRWAWWPGVVAERPVYAPALVSFFGGFGGVSVGIGVGQAVGWVPLGPDEVYIPWYRHSPRYVRNVNITYVRNETTIINVVNNKTVINNYNYYHNRNGATVVRASVMTGSRPVASEFRKFAPNGHFDNQHWAEAKWTGGNAPIAPTAQTRGVSTHRAPVSPGPNFANGNGHQLNGGSNNNRFTGAAGQGQFGSNQGQNLKIQKNGQPPQGQGPALTGGSKSKLPPLLTGQEPSKGNFGNQKTTNGQFGQGGQTGQPKSWQNQGGGANALKNGNRNYYGQQGQFQQYNKQNGNRNYYGQQGQPQQYNKQNGNRNYYGQQNQSGGANSFKNGNRNYYGQQGQFQQYNKQNGNAGFTGGGSGQSHQQVRQKQHKPVVPNGQQNN